MRARKALVLSPFATVPLDAGQRKRAFQTTQLLRTFGYEITFILYAFEEGWKTHANEEWIRQMREQWDEVIVWRANPKVGTPPVSGGLHEIDEWWDEVIETHLKQVFSYRFFDLFVVHNVWLSKAFDFVPRATVRILDAHDVFSTRVSLFGAAHGTPPEFFLTAAKSEAHGASRADVVLGIQEIDAEWFARWSSSTSLCLPYVGVTQPKVGSRRRDYLHENKVVFGFLGSAHVFNTRGLKSYCDELLLSVGRTAAPVELRIGGDVCRSVQRRGPWVLCGRVEDEDIFFDDVDIVVAPVFEGSGFKVKAADAIARELPIIAADHATIGMKFDTRFVARSANELARMTTQIALDRPRYSELQDASRHAHADLGKRVARGTRNLRRTIDSWRNTILYDLSGLTEQQAICVLLSWSGAFHLMRFLAKQLVVAPATFHYLERLAPPGVFFISEDQVQEHANQIWQWITVNGTNSSRWGAKEEEILLDRAWASVFDDEVNDADDQAQAGPASSFFWHNVTWDQLIESILRKANQEARVQLPDWVDTLFIVDEARRQELAGSMSDLYPNIRLGGVERFDEFFECAIRVASGRARRLVVATNSSPRARVLRQLCAVRGLEYVGVADNGCVVPRGAAGDATRNMYARFETEWRLTPPETAC